MSYRSSDFDRKRTIDKRSFIMSWEGFSKYVGIQGVLALLLVVGYIAAIFVPVELPESYANVMTFVVGFYFAKNGGNMFNAARKKGNFVPKD